MRISDWSSDVCSSDLVALKRCKFLKRVDLSVADKHLRAVRFLVLRFRQCRARPAKQRVGTVQRCLADGDAHAAAEVHKMTFAQKGTFKRSEEHTSELQSLMRISYAVFCLKKKKKNRNENQIKINRTK